MMIIFDVDFAKALWGEEVMIEFKYENGPRKSMDFDTPFGSVTLGSEEDAFLDIGVKAWKYHLQQTATADDRIKYLGENI